MKRSIDATPRHIDNIPKRLLTNGGVIADATRSAIWAQTTVHKLNYDYEQDGKPKNLSLKSENQRPSSLRTFSLCHENDQQFIQNESSLKADKRSAPLPLGHHTKNQKILLDPLNSLVDNNKLHDGKTAEICKQSTHITSAATAVAGLTKTPDLASAKHKIDLFENEAQSSILDLAKAVSSTLTIQVYHRCFGKASGSFHPASLVDSESECIECHRCEKMMSPIKFVCHTHHSRETNVCHWGFNPYNWRYYIKLSSKQASNNLDEEELLIQFATLKSAPDSQQDELLASKSLMMPALLHKDQNEQFISSHVDNTLYSNHPASNRCPSESIHSIMSTNISMGSTNLSSLPMQQVPASVHVPTTHNHISGIAPSSSIDINRHYSLPLPTTSSGGTLSYADPASRFALDMMRPRHHAFNIALQREIYVTNNMATYLHAIGLNEDLINHITQTTLDIVRKSRLLL